MKYRNYFGQVFCGVSQTFNDVFNQLFLGFINGMTKQ
jgi:hypothetical protein